MCDVLQQLNARVLGAPSESSAMEVLAYLTSQKTILEPLAWTAVCGPWDAAVARVVHTVSGQRGDLASAWGEFVTAWKLIYASLKHICGPPFRWVITQTPPDGPWGGRAICAPTVDTMSALVRTYASRGECEMALQLLEPQEPAVPITDKVVCDQAGCVQTVSWAPKPSR